MFKRIVTAILAAAVAGVGPDAFGQIDPQTAGLKQLIGQREINKEPATRKGRGRDGVITEGVITIAKVVQSAVNNADLTMGQLPRAYGMTINCRGLPPHRVQVSSNGSIAWTTAAPNDCVVLEDPLPRVPCSFFDAQDTDGDGVQTRNYDGVWSTAAFTPAGGRVAVAANGTVTVTVTNQAICQMPPPARAPR